MSKQPEQQPIADETWVEPPTNDTDGIDDEPPVDYPIVRTTPFKKYENAPIGVISSEKPAFSLDEPAEELPAADHDTSPEGAKKRSTVKRVVRGLAWLVGKKPRNKITTEDNEPLAIEAGPDSEDETEDIEAVETDLTPDELEEILPSRTAPIPRPNIGRAVVEFPTLVLDTVGPTARSYQHITPPRSQPDHATQLDILPDDQGPGGQYWISPEQYIPKPTPKAEPNPEVDKVELMAKVGQVVSQLALSEAKPALVDRFYANVREARDGETTSGPELTKEEFNLARALSEMTQPIPRVSRPIVRRLAEEMPDRNQGPLDVVWLRSPQNPGSQ